MAAFIAFVAFIVLSWLLFVTFAAIFTMVRSGQLSRELKELKKELAHIKEHYGEKTHPQSTAPSEIIKPIIAEKPAKPKDDNPPSERVKEKEPFVLNSDKIFFKEVTETVPVKTPAETPAVQTKSIQHSEENESKTVSALMSFLRGGNIWVTVGVILLVLGLTFAYVYIDMVYHIPPEFKISAGFLLGVAVFAVGWWQRIERHSFGMVMQGGGIGIMYLSLFASVKIFEVLPVSAVFVLMTLLIALSVAISVYQSSQVLALFSVVIGFCVPLLLSSGSGNYIVLFSYYIIINLSVFAIALKKYWRFLNSTAFLFTLIVGLTWGFAKYTEEYFFNIEIFLVSFFLIFTAINIAASLKQPTKVIENIYAVSTSFAYITIQMFLVRHFEYGQAIASGTLGLFYIILCFTLFRLTKDTLRNLLTLYLSLGAVFANLAVPLALDGNWTAGIWAIEGAVLVLLGVYQKNRFFRWFGSILIFAGAFYAWKEYITFDRRFFLNSVWITRLFAASALLVSAAAYRRLNDSFSKVMAYISLLTGLLLWYLCFGAEAYRFYTDIVWDNLSNLRYSMLLFFIVSASAFIFNYAATRIKWDQVKYIALTPAAFALYLIFLHGHLISIEYFDRVGSDLIYMPSLLLKNGGWIGWIPFFAVTVWFCYIYAVKGRLKGKCQPLSHAFMYFTGVMFITANLGMLTEHWLIQLCIYLLVPVIVLWFAVLPSFTKLNVVNNNSEAYKLYTPLAITIYLLYDVLRTSKFAMPDVPISLPFINGLDLLIIAVFAGIICWLLYLKYIDKTHISNSAVNVLLAVTSAVIFIWLHCALGRGVSELLHISYSFKRLFNSEAYQLVIAIFWGITGFCMMMFGKKVRRRAPWIIGAVLLACDSIKLLFIDMSNAGTLPRIGSFMAVGLIFIIIGYFVPLPPKREEVKNETV